MKNISMRNRKSISSVPTSAVIMFLAICVTLLSLPWTSHALIGTKEGDVPGKVIADDLDGTLQDVSDAYGKKPVILVFWELPMSKSFLDYSMDELRFLNEYYEKHHESSSLEIYGIYVPEEDAVVPEAELDRVRDSIKVNKIRFPVLIDRGYKIFREYGVIALPSTVMIDKTGKISFIYPSFPLAARPLFAEEIGSLTGTARVRGEGKRAKEELPDSRYRRLYSYALQMYKKGLYEQAISPLNKFMEVESGHAPSHNLMGIILWKSGNYEGAVAEFEKAIGLDRKNVHAHFNYGLLLIENEKYDEAEGHIEKTLFLDPDLAEAHYIMGTLYKTAGRAAEALHEFEKSLALFGKRKTQPLTYDASTYYRISALFYLSELYAGNGNDKRAIELLSEAARVSLGLDGPSVKAPLHRSRDLMIHE